MEKFNNKGQSLVLFVIFIPILLGIMALVIDLGNALSKKREIDNVIEYVLDYGLLNSEAFLENKNEGYYSEEFINFKDELQILLDYNLANSDNKVTLEDGNIIITSEDYVEGIFSNIFGFKGFKLESEYVGYIDDSQERVSEKIK